MPRIKIINQLADLIAAVDRPHPVRVGIDGPGASGKTTLADELVEPLQQRGRPVIRASIDGFHHPPAVRYQRGKDDVAGYYHDSFDHTGMRRVLLEPLGPGGDRNYRVAQYDFRTESPVDAPMQIAKTNAVLIFEGVFVLRPELREHFDYRVYVDVDFDETTRRAMRRDADHFGSPNAVQDRYVTRYVPGQRMHLDHAQPHRHAHAVIDNNDPQRPQIRFKD